MDEIIYNEDGTINWNENGWPEPNPGMDMNYEGYSTDDMPNDIFDQWLEDCDNLFTDWGVDE